MLLIHGTLYCITQGQIPLKIKKNARYLYSTVKTTAVYETHRILTIHTLFYCILHHMNTAAEVTIMQCALLS